MKSPHTRLSRLLSCSSRPFSQCTTHQQLSSFTRRLFKLPIPPPSPSPNHHNLSSFLSHAERTSLSLNSTTYVGTHYEYTILNTLRQFAFSLHRIGGREDGGIDLVGTWHLPGREPQHALRIIAQCKALKTKLGPNLVRELEGAFRNPPVGWRTSESSKLALLVSLREATKGVREAMSRSAYPLMWMMIDRGGKLYQALWNEQAVTLGLAPLGVESRIAKIGGREDDGCGHSLPLGSTVSLASSARSKDALRKSIVFTWDEQEFPDMDAVDDYLATKKHTWLSKLGCDDLSVTGEKDLLDLLESPFQDLGYESQIDTMDAAHFQRRKLQLLTSLEQTREVPT
jgi:hypothetical protein